MEPADSIKPYKDQDLTEKVIANLPTIIQGDDSFEDIEALTDPTEIRYHDFSLDDELKKIAKVIFKIDSLKLRLSLVLAEEERRLRKNWRSEFEALDKQERTLLDVPGNSKNRFVLAGLADHEAKIAKTKALILYFEETKESLNRVEMIWKKLRGTGPD